MTGKSQVGNKGNAEVGGDRLTVDPGSAQQWPVPAAPGRLQLAAVETSASESYSGLGSGKHAQKEEGKALEAGNKCAVKMPHTTPITGQ